MGFIQIFVRLIVSSTADLLIFAKLLSQYFAHKIRNFSYFSNLSKDSESLKTLRRFQRHVLRSNRMIFEKMPHFWRILGFWPKKDPPKKNKKKRLAIPYEF